jgi:hypothetical protein
VLYVFLLTGSMGGPEPVGWVGQREGACGGSRGAEGNFFICFSRNPLKSPDSTKGIQGNASFFPWIHLDFLAQNSPAGCIRG